MQQTVQEAQRSFKLPISKNFTIDTIRCYLHHGYFIKYHKKVFRSFNPCQIQYYDNKCYFS